MSLCHADRWGKYQRSIILGSLLAACVLAAFGACRIASAASANGVGTQALSKTLAEWEATGNTAAIYAGLKKTSNPAAKVFYRVADIQVNWPAYSKNYDQQALMKKKYLADIKSILAQDGGKIDPAWLVLQAKFILASLAISSVNQIEYWSGTPATRAELEPFAQTARHLLAAAKMQYGVVINRLNGLNNFTRQDKLEYENASAGQTQVVYFGAYANYYQGLALARTSTHRDGFMLSAVKALAQWANGPASNGVKFQALLLSGKANLRSGRTSEAVTDLQAAAKPPSPAWLVYEARYQLIVAQLRGGHYARASASLKNFNAWLKAHPPLDGDSARMGLRLLQYRIAYARAGTIHSPSQRRVAINKAMNLLLSIISKAPQYQELIFTHISVSLPPQPDLTQISPVQVLAVAWLNAQKSSHADIKKALDAARFLLALPSAPASLKAQAQLIAGICYAARGEIQKAAEINLAFVRQNPTQKQAKAVLNMALSQLQQLNQATVVSAAVAKMTHEAIESAFVTYHENQWRFAYGVSLQQGKHYQRAAKIFSGIQASDPEYFEAQYQLVRIRARLLTAMMASHHSEITIRQAAREVIRSAQRFLKLTEHPPASASAKLIQRATAYRPNLLMLEASTALDPLREPRLAGAALDALDRMSKKLSTNQRGVVLRYRIRQYQMMGKSSQILPMIQGYARGSSENADDVIKGLIGQYFRESRHLRSTDLARSESLAASAASLLEQLIHALSVDPRKNATQLYVYQQLRAQELVYAGEPMQAWKLYKKLEKKNPRDLGNFIGGARAAYAIPNYKLAHSLYVRVIPKLEPGSSLYWDAYLYLIRSNQKRDKYTRETVQTLKSLVAIYGSTIGGKYYHKAFANLLQTYGIAD